MQFRLRHRSLQSEQQTVIIVRRIIHAVGIGNQSVEQRANLQELIPIPAGAGQARHLHTKHQSDVPEPNFRHQPLKADPALGRASRPAKIVINDDDRLPSPSEIEGPVRKGILKSR